MQDFHYQILPLHHVHDSQKELVNAVYEMWEMTFGKVLNDAGATLDFSDFFRSHSAGVILFKNEIVGFNLFTVFDLELKAHGKHPYFEYLEPKTIQSLKERKQTRLMTMEYFTVSATWRRKYRGIPWSEILTGLGLQYMDQSPADAVIGTPRMDLGVDKMCARLGAKPIQDKVDKMNYPCAVMVFDKEESRHFLNAETHYWVKRLWKIHLREKLQPGAREATAYNRENDRDLM
ncbi:MAG: hypothetical protein J7501_06305 [Bdellovibrio sp.]|nr:hypothetical protein [Bdellovibrio sp.]